MRKTLIAAAISTILAGCSFQANVSSSGSIGPTRLKCDAFTSPWTETVSKSTGDSFYWAINGQYYYRTPLRGEVCTIETRTLPTIDQ